MIFSRRRGLLEYPIFTRGYYLDQLRMSAYMKYLNKVLITLLDCEIWPVISCEWPYYLTILHSKSCNKYNIYIMYMDVREAK